MRNNHGIKNPVTMDYENGSLAKSKVMWEHALVRIMMARGMQIGRLQ